MPTILQDAQAISFTPPTVTLNVTVSAGSLLWAYYETHGGPSASTVITISDSVNGVWTQLDRLNNAAIPDVIGQAVFIGSAGGAITITINLSDGFFDTYIGFVEVGGANTVAGHTGQFQAAPGLGTDAVTSGSMTSAAGGLTLGFTRVYSGGFTPTPGTGFAAIPGLSADDLQDIFAEQDATAPGGTTAVTYTATDTGTTPYSTMGAVFSQVNAAAITRNAGGGLIGSRDNNRRLAA